MIMGMDYLGLGSKHWPIAETIRWTPSGTAIGCFDGTTGDAKFGDAIPAARKLLATGRFPALRVQMWYNSAHTIVPMEILKKRLPAWGKLAEEFPNVAIYISHSCEHNETDASKVKQRIELIKKLAPKAIPVNTPWKGAVIAGVITERHPKTQVGASRIPYIVSNDGYDSINIDVETYKANNTRAEIVFLWTPRFNLREVYEAGQDAPKPEARDAAPNRDVIRTVARMLAPIGAPPTPTFSERVVPFKKPLLYKVFAEDKKGNTDRRANKPLIITKSNAKTIDVITYKGQRVAKFGYYGTYTGGMYRHYSGSGSNWYGIQIANQAFKASGSEWVWFTDGKTIWGPVHPCQRKGFYQ